MVVLMTASASFVWIGQGDQFRHAGIAMNPVSRTVSTGTAGEDCKRNGLMNPERKRTR
jgi:hypothetical protein